MKCEQAQKLIDAFVDGELPVEEAQGMEAHLGMCGSCRQQVELSQRITHLQRSSPLPRVDLRSRIEDACGPAKRVSLKTLLETIAMRKDIRIGLATAFLAGAMALFTLYPRTAEASGAAKIWAAMAKAAKSVKAVHIVNVWYLQDGRKGSNEFWTDGRTVQQSTAQDNTGQDVLVATSGIDPAFLMVSEQIKILSAGASEPVDLGTFVQNRTKLRRIAIINRYGDMRHTFWVSQDSDLPVRKVDEELTNGKWVEVGYQTFEFIDAVPAKKK